MSTVMANDRLKFAIGRLERAAARVERLISEGQSAPSTVVPDLRLVEQHEQLRQHVRTAIGRIDSLIASSGR